MKTLKKKISTNTIVTFIRACEVCTGGANTDYYSRYLRQYNEYPPIN